MAIKDSAGGGNRPASTLIRRRAAERYPIHLAPFSATWLADEHTVNGTGMLVDVSTGGFAGRMVEPPAQGRLLHAKLGLSNALGQASRPIEADARVCGRMPLRTLTGTTSAWLVHFAIESIHPADEKLMAEAIGTLRAGRS